MPVAYRGSAQFYDLFALGKDEEQAFYRLLAQEVGSPALELGSGTGLFAVLLAQDGITVVGLERSPEMLNEARKKLAQLPREIARRLLFMAGDMSAFHLDREFRLVYIPSCSFQYLDSPASRASCLKSVRQHLHSQGLFVFDIWVGEVDATGAWRRLETVSLPNGGAVTRSISTRVDVSNNLIDTVLRFDVQDEKGHITDIYYDWSKLAQITVDEVRHLLDEMGFQIESIYSTFTRESWTPQADRAIFITEAQQE